MARRTIDLNDHLNRDIVQGHPADFPISMEPVFYSSNGSYKTITRRQAVVRQDTGEAIAVVSDRYTLVPHQRLLDLVNQATAALDVGSVPRGIYVDRGGARMRALFKFPALAEPVFQGDEICPCLKIENSYDGRSRVSVHIGAFRFVCTNLAVGGGGVFAGGFMAVHTGEIPIGEIAEQLAGYLARFYWIVKAYRRWAETPLDWSAFLSILNPLPKRTHRGIWQAAVNDSAQTVYDAYNASTHYATHQMWSYRTAFDLLERINWGFQERFSAS